jgi:hypothetical protein
MEVCLLTSRAREQLSSVAALLRSGLVVQSWPMVAEDLDMPKAKTGGSGVLFL